MNELKVMGKVVNQLRTERGLPKAALIHSSIRVTKQMVFEVIAEVWRQQYPQALTKPNFDLGEFTLDFVILEVEKKLNDLRRGVTPGKKGFDIPWDLKGVQSHVRDRFLGGKEE